MYFVVCWSLIVSFFPIFTLFFKVSGFFDCIKACQTTQVFKPRVLGSEKNRLAIVWNSQATQIGCCVIIFLCEFCGDIDLMDKLPLSMFSEFWYNMLEMLQVDESWWIDECIVMRAHVGLRMSWTMILERELLWYLVQLNFKLVIWILYIMIYCILCTLHDWGKFVNFRVSRSCKKFLILPKIWCTAWRYVLGARWQLETTNLCCLLF